MSRRTLALVLLLLSALVFVFVALPARREQNAALADYARARAERQSLRVRLAQFDRRMSEDQGATAVDGSAAVRALRKAALEATEGLRLSGITVSASANATGTVAARGRLVAEGRFVDALRLARRLAAPSSGLLLEQITLGQARDAVRLEATAFILRETS